VNLDVVGVALAVVVLTWLLWLLWTVIRGHRRSRAWRVVRILVAFVVAVVLVGWGSYWLMNSRTVQVMGDHVSRVDTTRKVVALTFDDGPDDAHVGQIVGDLQQYGVKGTFYVIGAEAAAHPTALRELVAAGEEIGNHSYNHRRLVFVSTTTVRHEVDATDAVIRSAGYTGPITFRPPYAKKLLSYPFEMASAGRMTVMWDLEPDSKSDISSDPQAMTRYVVDGVRPGSIIELHPWAAGNGATRKALPLIIAALRQSGYGLVTVSELLALR
jgi:peptidoglycan/xylan/chitin deacetylase (PgdA/CDA1 family)